MSNQRKKGTKLAGAYIPAKKDAALAKLAKAKGFPNKAAFLRAVFNAITEKGEVPPDLNARSDSSD
jgi:hypothetical protein